MIPNEIDYDSFSGLSNEVKSKLKLIRPKTLGQALRIDGVTPAAAIILLGAIKKAKTEFQPRIRMNSSESNSKSKLVLVKNLNFNHKN